MIRKNRLCVNPAEAAQLLGIGRTHMYKLIKDGVVHTVKLGGRTVISIRQLDRLINPNQANDDDEESNNE